ncbi:GrpB family protein [Rossellomorea aquimaris]|uniref:GrpB family protein n=1 Tax=Rossellomorea aquimaris TaxID=189382 RepID=UPI001CD23785|nr:GrpB family protein [Rossellomorea aquimaris]MCA1054114.1 GrpB family protein [Rossellomorea aquimaris]
MEKSEGHKLPKWATESIEIKSPDKEWIHKGEVEKEKLLSLLSPFAINEIEHIGSTSIPGLPAKPIIDLMAIIPSFSTIEEIADKLQADQWHYVPPQLDGRPWRRFFIKVEDDQRVAHLHAMLNGEPRWAQQITFRNRLKENTVLKEEYAELKRDLAKKYPHDREAYSKAKTAFINRVLVEGR